MHTLNSSVVLETKCLEVQNIPKIEEQNLDKPKMYNQSHSHPWYEPCNSLLMCMHALLDN
jgi:hypothetical protein